MDELVPTAGLQVEELTVRFGGLVAVDALSLRAPAGEITGLIGPNGAGKTTTFSACSGLVAPTSGTVRVNGHDVTRSSPNRRAQLGLGRTFQRVELFESGTVRQNVAMGREARLAAGRPLGHLRCSRSQRTEIDEATAAAVATCNLDRLADALVADLPTGQRRLVELARVVAGGFDVLLLDEPSSGLDKGETERFGLILEALVADAGLAILLVEHDMGLVMSTCDHIFVVDFGSLIFAGSPDEVRSSPDVRTAYLGASA